MTKKIAYLILICLAFTAVGCETLPRKFIRKKKIIGNNMQIIK